VFHVAEGGGEKQATGDAGTADVFISYATADKSAADSICAALERGGIVCWIAPRDVTPGVFYADAIVQAINSARILIVVLSVNSASSQHVLREVERASAKRRPLVAFRLDTTSLPTGLEYFLSASHWLDASGGTIERALPGLVDAVHRLLGHPGKAAIDISIRDDSSVNASGGVAATKRATPKQRRNRLWIAAAVVAVALLALLAGKFWSRTRTAMDAGVTGPNAVVAPAAAPAAAAISDKSIAVLPFLDLSEKKDEEYFADGTADEILNLLAKVPGLHVPARTSSFYFKGKSEDIPTIARRLLVANVLEGSVRKSGNRVRITVQLVKADNGYQLWSETYDRTLDDIFKVQDDIAGEVVKALKISLGANELPRAVATNNAEAHALLLQANYFFDRETPDDLTRAIGYFQKAIQLDADFAPAWAGLSLVLTVTWQNGWLPNDRTFQQQREQALKAADRAIAIDPNLADAHLALADVRYWFDWDWTGVDAELAKARAFDPASTYALQLAGELAALRGHLTDALQLLAQATEKDPLNSDAYLFRAVVYRATGQFTEALTDARKVVELAPAASRSHTVLAETLLAIGQPDAALAEVEKESDPAYRAYARARTYILVGRRADADAALAEFEKTYVADWAYAIASLHALRGEPDQAFLWLDRAYEQRDGGLVGTPSVNIDPDLKSIRGDPRYKTFLRKMNLPE
jgi:TolB-like protein/Tfp pilus assembly protein PilF